MWFWAALGLNAGAGRGEGLREGQARGAAAAKEHEAASDGLGPSGEKKKKKKKKKKKDKKKKDKKKIRQQQQQQQHTTTKESDGQKVLDVSGVEREKLQRGDLEPFGTSLSQESPVIDLCESSDAESDDDKGRLCNAKKAQKKGKATMISTADIKRINAALSSSKDQNRVLAAMGSTKITRRDLQCLRDGEWLNDEVINFFLATVQERVRCKRQLWYGRRAGDDDTKILNTHFFTKLSNRRTDDPNERLTYSYENVRRWIKFELADYDRIVVPLHEGNHWRTAVIDLARKRIICYDSLLQAQFGIRGLKFLARWVRDLYAEAYAQDLSLSDWSLELAKTAPQQSNTVDCGVFACMFAVTAGYNLPIKYGARDMAFFRRRILLDILDWGKEKTGVQARA
ncbi:Sentrin-specific protease [Hondaea fermentalgiana]|uniref:Sentrin-specific protease n=1 Tax=Hondaea fermentalgiana TaxID=2315210 RepID=A0A2R5G2U8_9STRA|nr:Sentrin-specific protease [Hondaea fermentalgiana]|eukprot:GBG24855.1 Sentrin-specific protease [Hondaea fermentalgiana]